MLPFPWDKKKRMNIILEAISSNWVPSLISSMPVNCQSMTILFCVADGLISSMGKRKGSPCQQDGDGASQAGKVIRGSIPQPDLPEVLTTEVLNSDDVDLDYEHTYYCTKTALLVILLILGISTLPFINSENNLLVL